MKPIKAAIVGPGNIARTHARILRELGVDLRIVQGTNAARAERFASSFQIPDATTRPEDILRSDVDVVHVCSPPNRHYEMVKALLLHGKHVLCEKPLCLEDHEAGELYSLAAGKGLIHATGFNVRFHEAIQEAKKLCAHPEFGRIRLIHGTYLQEFHSLPAPLDWRYRPELAGHMRAVTEIGSHWIDLAQYVSGQRITAVSAVFGNFSPNRTLRDGLMYERQAPVEHRFSTERRASTERGASTARSASAVSQAPTEHGGPAASQTPTEHGGPAASQARTDVQVTSEDAALIHFRFANGAIGSVVLSEASPGRINYLSLEITGGEHSLWWNSEAHNRLEVGSRGEGALAKAYPFTGGFEDTQRSLFRAFYADVARGYAASDPAYPTFLDGMRNVQICNAIYASAMADSRWVAIEGS